ncbi:MAG: PhoH family protein [Proteobacteria bacterium]|nr:PhoH family protein [Pseudomonadota bacterium]
MKKKAKAPTEEKRLFVLDTNILVHDPSALFKFKEHDIYLPMVVLEELDQGKKGLSDTARNIREANRFLDSLIKNTTNQDIFNGIALHFPGHLNKAFTLPTGKLFFQREELPAILPDSLPGNKPDNSILATVLSLQAKHHHTRVTLVSKDINLRIKAAVLGIHAEDYYNDQVLDDLSLMYSGMVQLPENFWEKHAKEMASWKEDGRTFYKISGDDISGWFPNLCVHSDADQFEAIVRDVNNSSATIEYVKDFRKHRNKVCGINARNREQNFALNLLMDPDIDFVTLVGAAGTGKTLLTLAAGLAQTIEQNLYREIIMTRVTVPVGEDIGFLPGTEEEKMTPWMGALMDNLEVLTQSLENDNKDLAKNTEWLQNRIRIRSLNFMRGRTFLNKFIIIDEAQNLTSKQMQTMVTRAGPGTKIVCLGNINQIDTPYLTGTTSGLTYVVQCFKTWEHNGHLTLSRGERSRLADHAIKVL